MLIKIIKTKTALCVSESVFGQKREKREISRLRQRLAILKIATKCVELLRFCLKMPDMRDFCPAIIIIIIIIITTQMAIFMVLSSWQNHCESSPGSFDQCRTAQSGRRPSDRARLLRLQVRLLAARVYTHHHHLLLLSPKADTHLPSRRG